MNNLKHKKKYSRTSGLTLIETLVALAIFSLAGLIIFYFFIQSLKTQNYSIEQATAIGEAQRGIETMVKELRETMPADTGAYPIESADQQQLIFYADCDRDSVVEKIRYYLAGSNFVKGITEPTGIPLVYLPQNETNTIISRYVRNEAIAIFSYFNENWPGDNINNPLATPADVDTIKLIHVYLKINVYPERVPMDFDLESDVNLRNMKTNF